ncbi:MAG: HAMP domain-containing histidine kinase [Phycisphaeraceae bacterium]|nr:HAMP domain-containing histidine kinase [Phycisphaeraceae bacterium]
MTLLNSQEKLKLEQAEFLLDQLENLQTQLEQVREHLTHSHRLATLGMLASIVAHEFNNILTPIISYAQLALSAPKDQELMRKAVEKALAGSERAARIASSVLGFAAQEDEQDSACLPAVVEESINCLGRHPSRDGIELHVNVPDLTLDISPLNLQQILMNIFLNARKVMSKGGGRLTITACQENTDVRIDVADTGPGIPEAVRERVFEPFVTQAADEQNPEQSKGTGLGLAICRDLVQSAGGKIWFDTQTGKGTTFHVQLPLAVDPDSST